ncbi:MAG: hypothetical protein REJ23_07850 [Brevundimonas sp.]|nr:hypothetical protein [Brevundimonas sp.]
MLVAILNAAGRSHDDDLDAMNAQCDQLVPTLVQARNEDFDHWSEAAEAGVASAGTPVRRRVSDIVGHLLRWRIGEV